MNIKNQCFMQQIKSSKIFTQPKMLFMQGGTAAGKSHALKKAKNVVPRNAVTIDADDIKGQLPEYQQMMGARHPETLPGGKVIQVPDAPDRYAAAAVHEESSMLAKHIQRLAAAARMNIVVDGTGDSVIAKRDASGNITEHSKFAKKLIAARQDGYEPHVFGVNAPTDVAVRSATSRARKTGRWVPEPEIRKIHRTVSANLPEIQSLIADGTVKHAEFWDRSSGEMRKIASTKGNRLVIHDQKAWQAHLDKAKETA